MEKGVSAVRTVDPGLVGLWTSGSALIRIQPNGWYYLVGGPYSFSVSADGQIFDFNGTEYQRVMGTGQTLTGVWRLEIQDGGDTWVEEILYRDNGTYTGQWTLNGAFDSEYMGSYIATGGDLTIEELRASVTTSPPDILHFDVVYGNDQTGTYGVAADGSAWTYHGPAGDVTYVRETPAA